MRRILVVVIVLAVISSPVPGQSSQKAEVLQPKAGKHYYFVKVTQKDGDMMWSAPVWVTIEAR